MRLGRAVVAVAIALLATSCGGSDKPGASVDPTVTTTPTTAPTSPTTSPGRTGRTVDVIDNAFVPPELIVTVGTEVIWTHNGTAPHSITASGDEFDSHPDCDTAHFNLCMQPGESFRFTFPTAGTFAYACKIHGELMSGTIVIE